MQGKTQLYPGVESDFFRNRLTHSLEVAQIAKSIAIRINHEDLKNKGVQIDTDLCEIAGLTHDIGHPPFGHQGEMALDECMAEYGGFEGNAQTLRVLTKIEKKFRLEEPEKYSLDIDNRVGLNLTMRSLASILKYDREIEYKRKNPEKPVKGFYSSDKKIVEFIKKSVSPKYSGSFKTIECYIMDIADDIAYSTYDLEDAFKAGFITPLDILYPTEELLSEVVENVNRNLEKEDVDRKLTADDIVDLIREEIFNFGESIHTKDYDDKTKGKFFFDFANTNVEHQFRTSRILSENGSFRTGYTSSFVGKFIRGTKIQFNPETPALSKVYLDDDTRVLVEILKTFTYKSQISSPRLKIAELRGKEIVQKIFNTLTNNLGYSLLPKDVQDIYKKAEGDYKYRIVSDFVSSMTDRYAIEFYGRITSENPKTIFKPF